MSTPPPTGPRRDLATFSDIDGTLDQLDRRLRGMTREHAQVLDLDAFRRRLDDPPPNSQSRTDREGELKEALNLAFTDLGAVALALVHHGALTDKRLVAGVQRIRQLSADLDAISDVRLVAVPSDWA
jgi:hypothetical protein